MTPKEKVRKKERKRERERERELNGIIEFCLYSKINVNIILINITERTI